jgi:hypothetical protein
VARSISDLGDRHLRDVCVGVVEFGCGLVVVRRGLVALLLLLLLLLVAACSPAAVDDVSSSTLPGDVGAVVLPGSGYSGPAAWVEAVGSWDGSIVLAGSVAEPGDRVRVPVVPAR